MEFIPFNEEKARQFEEKLSKNLLYRSTDNFIAIYNNKLINRNNDEINAMAEEVVKTYKNVTLIRRQFIVKSKEEIISEKFEVLFPHISFVATLKRIAENVLKENYPQDTRFVFDEENKNTVQLYDPSVDKVVKYEGAENLRNANEAIASNPFLQVSLEMRDFGDDGITFNVADVLKIDTSFITNIGNLLNDYLK